MEAPNIVQAACASGLIILTAGGLQRLQQRPPRAGEQVVFEQASARDAAFAAQGAPEPAAGKGYSIESAVAAAIREKPELARAAAPKPSPAPAAARPAAELRDSVAPLAAGGAGGALGGARSSTVLDQLKNAAGLSKAGAKAAQPEDASAKAAAAFNQTAEPVPGVGPNGPGVREGGAGNPAMPPQAPGRTESVREPAPVVYTPFNATPYQKKLEEAKKKIEDAKKLKLAGTALLVAGLVLIPIGLATLMLGKQKLKEAEQKDLEAAQKQGELAQAQAQLATAQALGPAGAAAAAKAAADIGRLTGEIARLQVESAKLKAEGTSKVGTGTAMVALGGIMAAAGIALILWANDKAASAKRDAQEIQQKWRQDEQAQRIRDEADQAVR